MFKQDFEWLTSNTEVAYPFVERVSAPTGSGGSLFSDMVVDAYVTYPYDVTQDIKLTSLGQPNSFFTPVEFQYADGSVAFTSTGSNFIQTAIGSWTLLEWANSTAAARLLLNTEKVAEFSWPVALTNAILVGHATQPLQPIVRSITVDGETYTGTVEIVGGYNILTEEVPTIGASRPRNTSRVRIRGMPGDGVGTYPDCDAEEDPAIYTINGVGPDGQGNFILDPRDCYRGQVPVTNPLGGPPWQFEDNSYKLFNDCSPCCDCDDYIKVYDELLREVYEAAKTVSTRFYNVKTDYSSRVDEIEAQKTCREEPTLELRMDGRHGWCVYVQLIVRNNGGCDADTITVDISMTGPLGLLVPDSGRYDTDNIPHRPFTVGGFWPNFTVAFTDSVKGARTLVAGFELYFSRAGRELGSSISGTASGTIDGTPVSASGSARLINEVFNKT